MPDKVSTLTASEARRRALNEMSEREFQAQVVELAALRGWAIHAERPARTIRGWRTAFTGHKGFPDLVLVRERRMVVAELKRTRGHCTAEQDIWLAMFRKVKGLEVYLWQPKDFETIKEVLT